MYRLQLLFILSFLSMEVYAQLDTLVITSEQLSAPVRVFIHPGNEPAGDQPVLYFTDGEKLIANGGLTTLRKLLQKEEIPGANFVFVSTIDPVTGQDRREEYFICGEKYLHFFEEELIPAVESHIRRDFSPEERAIAGFSFGGLNAAYFSAKSLMFRNFGLLSPITYPCENIMQEIAFSKNEGLKIFLSTGKFDAEEYVHSLQNIYRTKKYRLKVLSTTGGHDFQNWNAQLKSMINFLLKM